MKTVLLSKNMVHEGSLILVNRGNSLRGAICEKRLATVGEHSGVLLERRAASILQKLFDDIHCGEQIFPVSGYRPKQEQVQIYQNSLLDNGAEFTAKYVMPPNCSEHQSGLAIDLALNQPEIDFLRPYFPYTGICGAFRDRAAAFGFIERYPNSKENITGIAHEPWHFRYVGAPHSKLIENMSVTLEEYLLWLKGFPYGDMPLHHNFDSSEIEIFYLAAKEQETSFEIEEDLQYTVSGDNMDGFIITIWRKIK